MPRKPSTSLDDVLTILPFILGPTAELVLHGEHWHVRINSGGKYHWTCGDRLLHRLIDKLLKLYFYCHVTYYSKRNRHRSKSTATAKENNNGS